MERSVRSVENMRIPNLLAFRSPNDDPGRPTGLSRVDRSGDAKQKSNYEQTEQVADHNGLICVSFVMPDKLEGLRYRITQFPTDLQISIGLVLISHSHCKDDVRF